MTEAYTPSKDTIEQKTLRVHAWIRRISQEAKVGEEVTPDDLQAVLTECGANFEPSPELDTLSEYSNKAKGPGVRKVWGEARVNAYKKWVLDVCIPKYEGRYGKELPNLYDRKKDEYDKDVKYSGMMAFLGELTAYAAGKIEFGKYKERTENRAEKGQAWIDRKPGEVYEPSKNAAFLPEYVVDAFNYLRSTAPKK